MPKKLPSTPRSHVKNALRRLWLRSRERAAALKREKYTCERCGRKQSRAKGKECYVQVHHRHGIDWDGIVDWIMSQVLQTPEDHEVLCEDCHTKEHDGHPDS
jgi:5-methylcytosine-specific restriction endonuclease McrA